MVDNRQGREGSPVLSHGLPYQLPRRVGDDLSFLVGQDNPLPRNLPHPLDLRLHAGPAFVLGIVLGQEHLEAPVTDHPTVFLVASEHPGGDQGTEKGHDPHRRYHYQDQHHQETETK